MDLNFLGSPERDTLQDLNKFNESGSPIEFKTPLNVYCLVTGVYRVTDQRGSVFDMTLLKNKQYQMPVIKITDNSNNLIPTNRIILIY